MGNNLSCQQNTASTTHLDATPFTPENKPSNGHHQGRFTESSLSWIHT